MAAPPNSSASLDAQEIQQLNKVLKACGVSKQNATSQIYSHPESIHIIAPKDLDYLMQHATVLANHKDVVYDVRALTNVLWGMLQRGEVMVDRTLRHLRQPAVAQGNEAQGSPANLSVFTPSFASSSASASATSVAGGGSVKTIADVYQTLYVYLVQAFRVASILRVFEDPDCLATVRDSRRLAQVDIETTTRLAGRLNDLFLVLSGEVPSSLTGTPASVLAKLNVCGASYTRPGHLLFRTTESAFGAVLQLLGTLGYRTKMDTAPIARLLNKEEVWLGSGCGLLSTESYLSALRLYMLALLSPRHKEDGISNEADVACQLLLTRMARRPPFRWSRFRLLFHSVRSFEGRPHPGDARQDPEGSACFGMLLTFRRVQRAVQWSLIVQPTDSPSDAAAIKKLRRAVSTVIHDAWATGSRETPKVLSFYELLVLASVQGMPQADLTKSDALVQRATATQLSTDAEVNNGDYLQLLMGCLYTVPTRTSGSGGSFADSAETAPPEHALLSVASVLSLYDAISTYVYQVPLLEQMPAAAPMLNQLFVIAGLQVEELVKLCAWTMAEHLEEQRFCKVGTHKEVEVPPSSGGEKTVPASSESSAPLPSLPSPVALLMNRIARDVQTLFQSNRRVLQATPTAVNVRARDFPDEFRAITLMCVRHFFSFIQQPAFTASLSPGEVLSVTVYLYALRAYYPLSPLASPQEKKLAMKLLGSISDALAAATDRMDVRSVNALLFSALLPRSTTVAQMDRLELALFEAYLKSMSTRSAANAIYDDVMLIHWVKICLPAIMNKRSAALANAGHDFFVAPFLAEKYVSPLFMPTYVSLFVSPATDGIAQAGAVLTGGTSGGYGPLPVAVVKHFATMVRAACQGVERCDGTALSELLSGERNVKGGESTSAGEELSRKDRHHAAAKSFIAALSPTQRAALRKITPVNAVLLMVSALFDRICMLWNTTPGYVTGAREIFLAYLCALGNLLRCKNTHIVHRVCASIEALLMEHLRGSGSIQFEFLKYVSTVVDTIRGSTKVGIAEWYLKLENKVRDANYGKQSKL